MWIRENRRRYDRSGLRYESDLTDEEWAEIVTLIPPAKPGGKKRSANLREVVNGLMYILSTGCQWRAIPKDLAPRSTVYDYFSGWSWDGTLEHMHHTLYVKCREQATREASPTAAIIDAQQQFSFYRPDGVRAGFSVCVTIRRPTWRAPVSRKCNTRLIIDRPGNFHDLHESHSRIQRAGANPGPPHRRAAPLLPSLARPAARQKHDLRHGRFRARRLRPVLHAKPVLPGTPAASGDRSRPVEL